MMVGPIKKVTGGLPLTACVLICLTLTPAMANDPLAELVARRNELHRARKFKARDQLDALIQFRRTQHLRGKAA